jgi:FAD/FMN-containing dehydrogenase
MSTDRSDQRVRLDALRQRIPSEMLLLPDSAGYQNATRPDNASFVQAPAAVLRPGSADDLAIAVHAAGEAGARIMVQATGHGAGQGIGADTVIIDTTGLDGIDIDTTDRVARAGSGVTRGQLQQRAEASGLLGLGGTSPTVGVAGYTFAGGVGWLVRPYGLAAGSLRAVSYVDGTGNLRRAADDSPDPVDREALWAFRGGAPTGIAAELEFALFPVSDLWAGYLLWPAAQMSDLLAAWSGVLSATPDSVTSTMSLLHLPPAGPFPEELLDTTAVHLSYASTSGETALAPMRDALRRVAEPVVDTTGPADADRLAQIHLDPPAGVPARGTGFWLTDAAVDIADPVFAAARIGEPDGLNMIELRHVDSNAPAAGGAMSQPPGPFLVHAVGVADSDRSRMGVDTVLQQVRDAAGPADLGRFAPSFREGQPDPGDAYTAEELDRLAALADTLDPDHVLHFQRTPARADDTG